MQACAMDLAFAAYVPKKLFFTSRKSALITDHYIKSQICKTWLIWV
jgi:hypothetical protein